MKAKSFLIWERIAILFFFLAKWADHADDSIIPKSGFSMNGPTLGFRLQIWTTLYSWNWVTWKNCSLAKCNILGFQHGTWNFEGSIANSLYETRLQGTMVAFSSKQTSRECHYHDSLQAHLIQRRLAIQEFTEVFVECKDNAW